MRKLRCEKCGEVWEVPDAPCWNIRDTPEITVLRTGYDIFGFANKFEYVHRFCEGIIKIEEDE